MSSLNELLERRRAATAVPSHKCHGVEAQPSCLLVTTGTGETWVFPWCQLAVAHHAKTGEREQLRLVFTGHEVRLVGLNLTALRDLVAALQLARVNPAPDKYRPAADTEPFLEAIHVTPHERSIAGGNPS